VPITHGVIVLARLDSSRLPGKALADVGGRPVLSRLLERLRVAGDAIGPIVLATTNRAIDDPLVRWAAGESILVVRPEGPVDDVAGRFVAAAQAAGLKWAARVNGDSPLVDANLLLRALRRSRNADEPPVDLVTNLRPRRHPYGMAVEWVRVQALAELLPTFDRQEREHVTTGLYATLPSHRIAGIDGGDPAWADVRTVVDNADDLDRLRRFVSDHGASWPRTTPSDIVAWIAQAATDPEPDPEPGADGGAKAGVRHEPGDAADQPGRDGPTADKAARDTTPAASSSSTSRSDA
jgi:spore coat polysaccharide biosynthesis protein SpsF (cytidylyltransferase family)